MANRRHTQEFRDGAVRLVVEEKQPVAKVARELGISPNTLHVWVVKFRGGKSAVTPKGDRDLEARVRELEAENRRLKIERDILKKATAFFAKEPS